MNTTKQPNFQQLSFLEEIKLRGLALSHSADLEDLLLRIILICIVNKEAAEREFRKCPLEGKISMLKHDLKLYHNEKFEEYKASINKLNKLKDFRNLFAHCKIQWDSKENDISWFNILIISIVENKERASFVKMTQVEFNKKLATFRSVILDLTKMYYELQLEYNKLYPGFFDV